MSAYSDAAVCANFISAEGAFSTATESKSFASSYANGTRHRQLFFNASNSSAIFGDFSEVQPKAVYTLMIIKA